MSCMSYVSSLNLSSPFGNQVIDVMSLILYAYESIFLPKYWLRVTSLGINLYTVITGTAECPAPLSRPPLPPHFIPTHYHIIWLWRGNRHMHTIPPRRSYLHAERYTWFKSIRRNLLPLSSFLNQCFDNSIALFSSVKSISIFILSILDGIASIPARNQEYQNGSRWECETARKSGRHNW